MVFGIGEGKVSITIPKKEYTCGEKISGNVMLNLNSEKEARQLRIQFYGERRVSRYSAGRRTQSVERILQNEVVLDGNKRYPSGPWQYPFEFTVPEISKRDWKLIPGDGAVAGLINGILSNVTDPYANVIWYLDASLDLPISFDISKKMEITLKR